MQALKFRTQPSDVLVGDDAERTGFEQQRIAAMMVGVHGVEAEDFTTQVKTVHELVPTRVDAESLDTA